MKRLGKGQKIALEKKTRSGLEAKALALLDSKKIDYVYEDKAQKLSYTKPETKHTYLPDLIIGGVIYELKGYMDASTRLKMQCVTISNPDKKIVMVFQRDQPIRKGSKTMYSDWCNKNNIKWMLFKDFETNILKNHVCRK